MIGGRREDKYGLDMQVSPAPMARPDRATGALALPAGRRRYSQSPINRLGDGTA